MAQQTLNPYDRPGEDYDEDAQAEGNSGAYDPQRTPLGNPADPRGDYDPLRGHKKDKKHRRDKEDAGLRQGLQNAENEPSGLYNPDDSSADEASAADLDEEEQDSGFYRAGKSAGKGYAKHKARGYFRRHKKKFGIGGGILAGVIGGGVGLIFLLLPLKVEHIMNNLEDHFFSTSNNAMQKEIDNMVKQYLISRVLPGYQSCGSTIKAGCTARKFGDSPVSQLYRTWADERLETKMWNVKDGKGIKLEYNGLSQKWRVYGPGLDKSGVDIGKDGAGLSRTFDDHADFRDYTRQWMKDNTKWYRIMLRYQVDRNLTGGKYSNSRFCVVFCFLTDPLHKEIDKQKMTAKIFLTNRVILPRNESLGVALLCLINDCNPADNQPSDDSVNGEPTSEYNQDTRATLEKYAAEQLDEPLTTALIDETLDKYNAIAEVGFQKYLVTTALKPIIGTAAAGTASDVIPIVGWANLAAQVVNVSNDSSDTLKKLRYTVNGSVAAVSLYAMYRAQADELHTGHETATEAGSFAQSLSPGNHGASTDPIVGGTAGAEQVPLYSNIVEGKSASTSATGGAKHNYLCNDGSPLPAGQLICPEEFLGGGNSIANGIHSVINTPPLSVLIPIAQAWRATVGQIFEFAGGIAGEAFSAVTTPLNALCDTPVIGTFAANGYCAMREATQAALPAIVEAVTKWLIPDPFSTNMSGGRTFDMIAAGGDVLGNDTAHTMLGGQKLSNQQKADILAEQKQDEVRTFQSQPFFARMFSTESKYSLVSKVAMDVPLGGTEAAAQSGVATLLNPVSILSRGFGSIFTGQAKADNNAEDDPFGVPQYGYPAGTIPSDPEGYWDAHCSDDASHAYQKDGNGWNEAASGTANADPDTGTPLNKTTNPCLLIKAAVGAAGGLFDTKNLTEADLGGSSGGSPTDNGGAVAGDVDGTPQELAKALVDSGRLTDEDGRYMAQIKAVANGNFTCNVNPYILQMLYGVVVLDKHSVKISSLNRYCTGVLTASGPASYHYTDGGGHAVDVTGYDNQVVDGGHNAGTLGYLNEAVKYLPKGSGFGQVTSCGSGFQVPAGDDAFDDSCNHQHIQVPIKRLSQ